MFEQMEVIISNFYALKGDDKHSYMRNDTFLSKSKTI